jgi:ATP-binding cassette, subfamily B, bacterial
MSIPDSTAPVPTTTLPDDLLPDATLPVTTPPGEFGRPETDAGPAAKAPGTFTSLKRLLPYARPALGRIVLGAVSAFAAALVALAIPQVLEWLVDDVLTRGDSRGLGTAVVLVLVLGALEAVLIAGRRWFVLGPATRIEADMRHEFYGRLQVLPVAFHDRWPSGQLLSRAMSDLNTIRRWLAFGLVLLVVNLATVVVGAVILIAMHPLLGIVFLVCSVPLVFLGLRFERQYSVISRRSQDQTGDLATSVEESVHGIRVLKAFGRGRYALDRFVAQAETLRGTELDKARAIGALWRWLLLVPDVAFALCLLVGVWLAEQGQLTVGELVAFFATAAVLRFPIESIGFLLSATFDARTAADRFFEVLDEPVEIADPDDPQTLTDARGALVLDDVHFRYQDTPEGERDLIDGVNLSLAPGETVALVGITGSGKTTLTTLPTRLYDVTGGRILLDGVDIRQLRLGDLRLHIAMAFEDPILFSASIRDNVLMGRPGGTEADAVEALEVAQAAFVHGLADGIDTVVGEEGLSLSGGQRQRLALARAIAARPRVLVMDDPLSALDVATEERVEVGLRRVLADTTTLIVAHRPSTVMLADRVALLRDGVVEATGTHSELLARNEHYRFVISSLEDEERDAVRARGWTEEER